MERIKKDSPSSFWFNVVLTSIKSVFTAEETRKKWIELILSLCGSVAFAFLWVYFLGDVGIWAKSAWNAWTAVKVFILFFTFRFLANLVYFPSRYYFDIRKIADTITWGDVSSSVWKEPDGSPTLSIGVSLKREEHHQVNYMRGTLRSIAKNGVPMFTGADDCHLPIMKDSGQYSNNWMASFSESKPRNILLAYIEDGKMRIDTAHVIKTGGQVKVEKNNPQEYHVGTYAVIIDFKSEGNVNGHIFKGDLVFDGKSLDLRKRKK